MSSPPPDAAANDYSDLVLRAGLADYSPVRGCMVIKPYGYKIWELIQAELNQRFQECGHENAYFPLLIPESFLKREAEHVEGFAPECAVVTHAGGEALEEPLVVRPTSETIIYHMFGKWIRSWRDLPMSVNQWANVMRWEMRTRLFLRTSEFLWQEGHTAHATAEEANTEARRMLRVYQDLLRNVLALAPIGGTKTASERFAGAQETFALEVLLRDGKVLQTATSHHLSQGFAESFDIRYQTSDNELELVHLTSWGVSTRLIGALILGHRDDAGLILPPRIAPVQVVVIPIYRGEDEKHAILDHCQSLAQELKSRGLRAHADLDEQSTPGAKFNTWELKGVPLRVHVGPRDLQKEVVELARRDTRSKIKDVARAGVGDTISELLTEIQTNLFQRHMDWQSQHTRDISSLSDLDAMLAEGGGLGLMHWDGTEASERALKEHNKATIRVVPFEGETLEGSCAVSGQPVTGPRVYVGRAY